MIKNIAIIPARLGSKRIPFKNILPLNGKALIGYTIETAIKTKLFDKIIVATESTIIAEISKKFGAEIFYLDTELTKDNIFANEVVVDILQTLKEKDEEYNNVFLLQPTSPLRLTEDIKNAYNIFIETPETDFLVSGVEIDPHYFHWALQKKDNNFEMIFPNYLIDRSLLPKRYRPDGAIKIANIEKYLEIRHFFGEKLQIYQIPETRAIHIGTQYDWDLCEFFLKRKENV